jgi:hypothetical protein
MIKWIDFNFLSQYNSNISWSPSFQQLTGNMMEIISLYCTDLWIVAFPKIRTVLPFQRKHDKFNNVKKAFSILRTVESLWNRIRNILFGLFEFYQIKKIVYFDIIKQTRNSDWEMADKFWFKTRRSGPPSIIGHENIINSFPYQFVHFIQDSIVITWQFRDISTPMTLFSMNSIPWPNPISDQYRRRKIGKHN